MQDVLQPLTLADYTFLAGLVESPFNLTDDAALHHDLAALEVAPEDVAARDALNRRLEREIRYLGSADLAYLFRSLTGQSPGVPFEEIIRDVAKALKVTLPAELSTNREKLKHLVETYATQAFGRLSPEQQQEMLTNLGVEQDKAAAFIAKSAGVFAVPALVEAFNVFVVQGLIKNVVFGTIAKVLGRTLTRHLYGLLASRFPWWVSWIGPAAWSFSIGWAVLDLQGPATRKTVPVVLYLGLCSLRPPSGPNGLLIA